MWFAKRFNSKKVQFNSSFRLLGESVKLSMERLHYLLVFAIEREYKKNFASNYNLVSFYPIFTKDLTSFQI